MGVFYVHDSKFDVVFDLQETGRRFVIKIGFPRIYSKGVLYLLGIETDEGGDYILYMDMNKRCTIAIG